MSKDFFDEEFEKVAEQQQQQQQQRQNSFDNWYNHGPVGGGAVQKTNKKPLYISLICVAMVLCIVLGWVLCTIMGGATMDDRGDILQTAMEYMDEHYYQDISDAKWSQAVEAAGTALLQTAGDRFCMLLSPQSYYDIMYPASSVVDTGGVFGVSFSMVEGLGMAVSEVLVDSPSYGALQEMDIVVKLSNINNGNGANVGGAIYLQRALNDLTVEKMADFLQKVRSATFHVLRNGDLFTVDLTRGPVYYNQQYKQFEFVEFYYYDQLGNLVTNVSTPQTIASGASKAKIDTETARFLTQMPKNVAYVRLRSFMDTETTQSDEEFAQVLQQIQTNGIDRLVLDLKGNPGGNVQYAANIAGHLIRTDFLTSEQYNKVVDKDGNLLVTTLEYRNGQSDSYTAKGSYNFKYVNGKCNVVVWTDGNSASASELLTGTLLDYGTAVHMGTRTYGKGIAQAIVPLTQYKGQVVTNQGTVTQSNWAVYFTCAKYYSPLGTNIHEVGYVPSYDGLDTYPKLWNAIKGYWGL